MRYIIFSVLVGFSGVGFAHEGHGHHHDSHAEHHQVVDHSQDFAEATEAKQVRIEQCWVRLLPADIPSAGYFVIHNESDVDLELIAGATPSYQQVMLHETIEHEGMAKMVMADKIVIPAQSLLEFKPGGLHAMYEQPTGVLQVGDVMDMTLLFSNQKKATATCKVNSAKARSY